MISIGFLNLKGGVTKTTSSVNVAKGLSNKRKRTILIDLDPQGNSSSMFGRKGRFVNFEGQIELVDLFIEPGIIFNEKGEKIAVKKTIADVLLDPTSKNIEDSIIHINDYLSIIPANQYLNNTTEELQTQKQQQYRVKKIVDYLKNDYDYCVIDASPNINLLTINIIIACTKIILPFKVDLFTIQGYKETLEQILNINKKFYLNLKVKVLFAMVNRNNIDKMIINQFDEKSRYITTIRYQAKPITYSGLNSIFAVDMKTANVGQDYRDLVEEIIKESM